mgnify:CR=1 FL=1
MRILRVLLLLIPLVVGGCSGSTDTGTTDDVRLEAPANLAAQRIGQTSVRLTWEDMAAGEEAFAVERLRGAGTFASILFVPPNATQAVDSLGLYVDSTYVYRVRAFRYVKSSGYSNAVTVQFTLPYP